MDELTILQNFGFNFKIERMRLKYTQDDIMDKTGFSKSYISNVENGKHSLSLVNAVVLAKIVNKSIEELIEK